MRRAAFALVLLLPLALVEPGHAQAPTQVTCESQSDRYTECPIAENSRVRLVRTLSNTPCVLSRTYGAERTRIWVRSGCRGVFEVTPSPVQPEKPDTASRSPRSYLVRCESRRNSTSECPVDPSATVTLATQRSGTPCTEGQTWGRAGGSVFVAFGCRAEFEVTPSARPGNFNRPDNTTYWITCESRDNRRFHCRIGDLDTPRMSQQLSRSSCTEGSTWGVTAGYLWVDRGCRAEFEVTRVKS